MLDRKLKKYRIIPAELYVERKADQQVATIIKEMESPGYVLVARQMGKTNLLLHAKEVLASTNDIFSYNDLSNLHNTVRDCFRNIIDTILQTKPAQLQWVKEQILENRKSLSLAPHLEHQNELKLILDNVYGKLVIILDEIDALLRASYSDDIFKQIRSVYFEGRTNFPSFKKLTYLLSGVIEPTDLIKDPKISPFNIGEKIYLDDFTYGEFKELADFAATSINETLLKHVYGWCNGNPRISYDILSEIESLLLRSEEVTNDSVDLLVKRNYLTSYDIPPVDHIRGLIQHDKNLRNSITLIRYNKTDQITDKNRQRLYLAGIISSPYSTDKIRIKNKIIDAAINEQWISQIDKEHDKPEDLIYQYFSAKKFDECISFTEDYLLANKGTRDIIYTLALSYFYTKNYIKAYSNFEACEFDSELDKRSYINVEFLKGVCLLKLKKFEDAINKFVLTGTRPYEGIRDVYFNSLLNLGTAKLYSKDKIENVKPIWEKLIDEIDATTNLSENETEAYCYAQLNLLKLSEETSADSIKTFFEKILKKGNQENQLCARIEYLKFLKDSNEKLDFLNNIRLQLRQLNLKPVRKYDLEGCLQFNSYHILAYFIASIRILDKEKIKEDIDWFLSRDWEDIIEKEEILHWIASELVSEKMVTEGMFFYRFYLENRSKYGIHRDMSFKTAVYNLLEYATNAWDFETFVNRYEIFLQDHPTNKYTSVDFIIIFTACGYFFNAGNYPKVLSLAAKPVHFSNAVQIESKLDLILGFYWCLKASNALGLSTQSVYYANEVLRLYNENKHNIPMSESDRAFFSQIIELAQTHASALPVQAPNSRKVTVRYKDGRVKKNIKYKLIEKDLQQGKCSII